MEEHCVLVVISKHQLMQGGYLDMGDDAFVIGNGFVGKGTRLALDIPWYFSRQESNITLNEGAKKKWCFICLPTPTNENGGQEEARKVIHDYLVQMKSLNPRCIFVIRSTVIPGTARALSEEIGVRVVSCPEFLSEETWEKDSTSPRIIVMGADEQPLRIALENLWKDIPCKVKIVTDTLPAETFKYAFNSFMVTKIAWANSLFDICEKNGADYEMIHYGLH